MPTMRPGIVLGSSRITLAVTGPLAQRNPRISHKHEPSGGSLFIRQRWLSALLTGPVTERPVGQDMSREGIHQQRLMANPPHVDLQLGVGDLYGEGSTPNHARAAEGDIDLNTRCITRYSEVVEYNQESQRTLSINKSRSSLDVKERREKTECRVREMKEQAFLKRLETLEAGRDWRGVLAAMIASYLDIPEELRTIWSIYNVATSAVGLSTLQKVLAGWDNVASACDGDQQPDSARSDNVKLGKGLYNKAVSAIAKSGRWLEAMLLVDTMRIDGLVPDEYTYSACIDACAKAKRWKKACQLLNDMREGVLGVKPNGYAYNSAINACGKALMWKEALALLRMMESENVRITTVTLNAAMDACGMAGECEAALGLLETMQSEDSPQYQRPNSRTFNIAIKACAKVGEWRTALYLLKELRAGTTMGEDEARLCADIVSFNATINALGRGRQWEKALALLREMKEMRGSAESGVEPNTISYNSAIDACGRGEQWQVALALLREMRELGIPQDEVSFGTVASVLGRAGQWSLVLELVKDMEVYGVSPTEVVLRAAADCCSKAGEWQRAVSLIEDMRSRGYLPAVGVLATVIAACGRAGQWEVALALLEKARHRGPRPTVSLYIVTAQACARAGKWEEAMDLMEGMSEDGVRPNEKFYMALLRATGEGSRADKTIEILQQMGESGITPGVRSYNCAVGACGKSGNWKLATTLLSEMLREGMQPAGFAVASTIRACSVAGEWGKGLQVLQQSQQLNSSKPDPCSLSAAIEMCCWAGKLDHAWRLMPHLEVLSGTGTADGWIRYTTDILKACSGESKKTEEITHDNVDANLRDSRRTLQGALGVGEHNKIEELEDGSNGDLQGKDVEEADSVGPRGGITGISRTTDDSPSPQEHLQPPTASRSHSTLKSSKTSDCRPKERCS